MKIAVSGGCGDVSRGSFLIRNSTNFFHEPFRNDSSGNCCLTSFSILSKLGFPKFQCLGNRVAISLGEETIGIVSQAYVA